MAEPRFIVLSLLEEVIVRGGPVKLIFGAEMPFAPKVAE
jgi:hypothetical protein